MKKIIAGTLLGCAVLTSSTFAAELQTPVLISAPIKMERIELEAETISESDIIIRNNTVSADYDYNSTHYYTTKIETKDIVVPKEIKKEAKKIYFLVEEGRSHMLYAKGMAMDEIESTPVNDTYNYKTVEFTEWKKEYIFNNSDLVKDFDKNDYKSVTMTLVAEMKDGKQVALANSAYINISNKEGTLSSLVSKNRNADDLVFGYYNSDNLELYLEEMSDSMTRSEYKKMLTKAHRTIASATKKNEAQKDAILKEISRESHFEKNISKYSNFTETQTLLSNLQRAVKNQLQDVRAFDAIDKILK